MFVGDDIFPGEVYWGTRCPMFAGDAVFPGEVHWGTRCPMFVGDAVFPGEVHCAHVGYGSFVYTTLDRAVSAHSSTLP